MIPIRAENTTYSLERRFEILTDLAELDEAYRYAVAPTLLQRRAIADSYNNLVKSEHGLHPDSVGVLFRPTDGRGAIEKGMIRITPKKECLRNPDEARSVRFMCGPSVLDDDWDSAKHDVSVREWGALSLEDFDILTREFDFAKIEKTLASARTKANGAGKGAGVDNEVSL